MTKKTAPTREPYLIYGLYAAAGSYMTAWVAYVYFCTSTLRGFLGDGALAFLAYLSRSYVFNQPGHLIHLFPAGFPRDFQMWLNALSLQAALWLNIQDAAALKYMYVFWQTSLPGFLYIGLFVALWRTRHLAWGIFPLIGWAILSVPTEWITQTGTRWAMPIFWMHFFLVIFAPPKPRLSATIAVGLIGVAMLGGLYETVTVHCALCLGFGALAWYRRQNRMPFLYALTAIPGAIRAAITYAASGHSAPNGYTGLTLPHVWQQPYFFFIAAALLIILAFGSGKMRAGTFYIIPLLLLFPAVILLSNPPVSMWAQIGMRFDYAIYTLLLMLWAGALRVANATPEKYAPAMALTALLAGTILWTQQVRETTGWWATCRMQHSNELRGKTLAISRGLTWLFADNLAAYPLDNRPCFWDWTQPWTDLLFAPDGKVESWTIMTFWQDFDFVRKDDGQVYLHTNNWTMNSPAMQPSSEDLPLKTLLYDLTPLYDKLGLGPLAPRVTCMPPQYAGGYWRDSVTKMDDATRARMHVCPATPE